MGVYDFRSVGSDIALSGLSFDVWAFIKFAVCNEDLPSVFRIMDAPNETKPRGLVASSQTLY